MMRSLSLVNQCVWMYLKHECSMEMLSWVSDTLGFLVLCLPHVKFTFTSVILCLVFVAYFLFYFISQSSCVQLWLSWLCAPVSHFFPAMSNPQEPSECESCHSCVQFLIICYHRFVLADMELSGFILPFQFMDFVTLGPELQSKFNIPRVYFHYLYPLAWTLAIAISSHMKLLSACQGNPGFFLHILMKGAVLQCLII